MKASYILVLLTLVLTASSKELGEQELTNSQPSRIKKNGKHPLFSSDNIVWAGLDYSLVRLIGTNDFNIPEIIFPNMFERWNALFLEERVELIPANLRKRVNVDIAAVTERNKTATSQQVVRTPPHRDTIKESHISSQQIATEIKSYQLKNTNGLGLVFIIDRFVERYYVPFKEHGNGAAAGTSWRAQGAVYIVFFDIATREVISVAREVEDAGGANFRNFWFGVIKDADKTLRRYR